MLSTPLMFQEICKMFSSNLASSISINTSPVSNSCGLEKLSLITPLKKDSFRNYMKSIGKLGGQNKCPLLSNDRKIGDFLSNYLI